MPQRRRRLGLTADDPSVEHCQVRDVTGIVVSKVKAPQAGQLDLEIGFFLGLANRGVGRGVAVFDEAGPVASTIRRTGRGPAGSAESDARHRTVLPWRRQGRSFHNRSSHRPDNAAAHDHHWL